MAINIKELFDADSDNIKVEKTNYNFDQILANGGGPIGPKGVQGTTGNTGQKGQKGDEGQKGDQGQKGEQGASLNIWDKDTMTDGLGDLEVLRPFNNPSEVISRVILGEDTVNNTTPTYLPPALLSLIISSTLDEVSNQIQLKYDDIHARDFYIRTEYESITGTTLVITGAAAHNTEKTSLNIIIPDDIELNSKTINLKAQNDINIENTSLGNITIGTLNGATYDTYLYSDNIIRLETNEIELEASDIIANANNIDITATSGTIDLNADTTTLTAVVKNELIAPDNELTATGKNTMSSAATGPANVLNTTSSTGINTLQNSGVDKFFTGVDLNTSTQNIFFSVPNGDHDGTPGGGHTGADYGNGIQFKEGDPGESLPNGDTAYASANNGSTSNDRTLNDYFHKSVGLWNQTNPYTRVLDGDGTWTAKNFYSDNGWNSLISNLTLDGSNGTTNIAYNNWGSFEYTKVGNIIHGFGSVRFSGTNQGWTSRTNENRQAILIDLNVTDQFPFVNSSDSPCVVDVSFGGNSYDPVGNNITKGGGDQTTGEWDNPNSHIVTDNALIGLRDIVKIKGIIVPGRNEIVLLYDAMNINFASTGGTQNDIDTFGIVPSFFSTGYPVTINFSFTMLAKWNSYDRVILDTAAPPQEGESSGGSLGEESISGGGSAPSGTEIEMFSGNPNNSLQEQPMTTWATQVFAENAGTYTQTFYSNMDVATGGITFSNLPSWVSSASISGGGSFPSSLTNLSGSTVYMWTLSVTLLGHSGGSTRIGTMDIVSDDPSTWSLPSGVSTWNISQQGV